MAPLVRVLGPVEVLKGGRETGKIRSAGRRRLIALLTVHRNSVVPAERICDILEVSPGALRTTVSRMRETFDEDVLVTRPPGYSLVTDDCDVAIAKRLIAEAATASSAEALAKLTEALALWRGPSLVEFADEEWARGEAVHLDELRAHAVEARAEALMALDRADEAIGHLEAHIGANPLRDSARRLLMQALANVGRTVEALRVFQDYRDYLIEETGSEPSPASRKLDQLIATGGFDSARSSVQTSLGSAPTEVVAPTPGESTFLFTDVVGSTQLWEQHPDAMSASLRLHDVVVRAAIQSFGGRIFSNAGDSFAAAFARSRDAVQAALRAQDGLAAADWGDGPELLVRMGLHRGPAEQRDSNFFGPSLNVCARVCDSGHGGQILLTGSVDLHPGQAAISCGSHRLKGVGEPVGILQLGNERFPPLRALDTSLSNLPAASNDLIGRAVELSDLADLVATNRLVTLTGIGGIGKTRLAYAAAADQLFNFTDGVWVAELAACSDMSSVLSTIAETLRVPVAATAERLADLVRGHDLLLVLDNCEHVLDVVADVCNDLIDHTVRLKLLATSRERLGIEPEHLHRVEPLRSSGAAQELFIQRAAHNGVEVISSDTPAVTQICSDLDGIPLAIELAAATSRIMTPVEIVDRLGERFEILRGSNRGRARGRHETLRAAVDWSYEHLDEPQQALFRRLSVFNGGFPLEAAERMAADLSLPAVHLLADLVDCSLLGVETRGRHSRYTQLATLRQYGQDRLDELGERPAAVEAHAHWCQDHATSMAGRAFGALEGSSVQRLVDESANFRVAISRLLESGDAARAVDLVLSLDDFSYVANVLAELVGPLMDLPAIEDHPGQRRLMAIELVRRSTSDGTEGRASLAAELSAGLQRTDPGAMQIPVVLIANALSRAEDLSYMQRLADYARSLDDPPERARLLIAAVLGTFYAPDLPNQEANVAEAMNAARGAGMNRLLIPAGTLACLGGLATGRYREATEIAGPILACLDELTAPSIMSSGLITTYTETAVRAGLPSVDQLAGVRRLGPSLQGDFDRVGLALARLVEVHGSPELAVRALGACSSGTRSQFSVNQRASVLEGAAGKLGEARVEELLDSGAESERSDLYREMWAVLTPSMGHIDLVDRQEPVPA